MNYIIEDVDIFNMAYRELIREKKKPTGHLIINRAYRILNWINYHNRKVKEFQKLTVA